METDLTEPRRGKPIRRSRLMPALTLILAFAVMLFAAIGAYLALSNDRPDEIAPASGPPIPADPTRITASDPGQLKAVSPEAAEAANAAIPIARLPNPAAAPLVAPTGDGISLARGIECMTNAIYYEAASEPVDGQRAVAQVVLNRARHSQFPHTICGVVYQGAERVTGCQFSFTCDGSLARRPLPQLWVRARQIALQALTGSVYAPVGWATHYHADYVLPYWAPTLTKLAVVGRHIFYRLPRSGGSPAAFAARYAGGEPDVSSLVTAAVAAAQAAKPLLPTAGDLTVPTPAAERPVLPQGAPAADRQAMPVAPLSTRWIVGDNRLPVTTPSATPTPAAEPAGIRK